MRIHAPGLDNLRQKAQPHDDVSASHADGLLSPRARLTTTTPRDTSEQEAEHVSRQVSDRPEPSPGHDFARVRVHAAAPALMRQPEGGPGEGGGKEPKPAGPFLLPEVTVTAQKSAATGPPFAPDDKMARFSVRDVTFVKVQTWEEVERRAKILNKLAEDEVAEEKIRIYKDTTPPIGPGPEEEKQKHNEAAQQVLKNQFGDF